MEKLKITIFRDMPGRPAASNRELSITFEEFKQWVVSGTILKHLFRYSAVRLVIYRTDIIIKPFLTVLLLKLISRSTCIVEDKTGFSKAIKTKDIIKLFTRMIKDLLKKPKLIRHIEEELSGCLEKKAKLVPAISESDITSGQPAYLRTDLWFGVSSGGSVGHIAGVLNNLDHYSGKPVFLTSDMIPTVRGDIEAHYITPDERFWDFQELPGLHYNERFYQTAKDILKNRRLSFIYQRYSLGNYSGFALSRLFSVPFILEYNGSEIWINRHWGTPLKYEKLSERIEMLNLSAAQLIVVVSRPMKDELIKRGITPDKILVNPNGVDPDRYSPLVNGSTAREKYNILDKIVVGFIGTFGKWHGAEVLAAAFGRLLQAHPEYRKSIRLLMIGEGITMPQVKDTIAEYGIADFCILTGRVPQEDGPSHLAACDILASPHVPNPDGTPFFGSPTKLFEYMAMGKGIVASDLDQIGEILKHEKTAWMVKPGDVESLMFGLKTLIDRKELRESLGKAAREDVVANYTWKEHTRKIINEVRRSSAETSKTESKSDSPVI